MLVEFRLRNYRCFKDEQVLSLVASSDDSLPQNLITDVPNFKGNLLRSVVIYGPNASGKTTILEALYAVHCMVIGSANAEPDAPLPVDPFLLDPDTRDSPTAFEVTFVHEGVRYQYGLEADHRRVYREYLYSAPRGRTATLFEREYDEATAKDEYYFGSSLRGQKQQIAEATRPNALFLSVAASLNQPTLRLPYAWFRSHLGWFQHPQMGSTMGFLFDENLHKATQSLLRLADLGIEDYRIDRGADSEKTNDPRRARPANILMAHISGFGTRMELPLAKESRGTIQVFALSSWVVRALNNGRVLLVDELDASLHPELARSVIGLFHHPALNANSAQLIFNAHDTTLMDQALFRRDQIWFTEKDANGAAHLYSLLEFRPRNDASLAKGYLQGRYGALPFLGNPEMLLAEEGR